MRVRRSKYSLLLLLLKAELLMERGSRQDRRDKSEEFIVTDHNVLTGRARMLGSFHI